MANQIIVPQQSPEAEQAEVDKNKEAKISPPVGPQFKYDASYHQMAEFLGLQEGDKMDEELAQKISFIRDYTGEKDELDAMVKIRDMIRMLGTPVKGKELVKVLYQYTRLKQQQDRIDKEMSLITP